MKRIRVKEDKPTFVTREETDVERLVGIFQKKGFSISSQEARILWEKYSDSLCAGWLKMDEDDNVVFDKVQPYFEVIDED